MAAKAAVANAKISNKDLPDLGKIEDGINKEPAVEEIMEEEDDGLPKKKKKSFGARFATFMFSELGLVLIILGYIVLGGLLFRAIEFPGEKNATDETRKKALDIEAQRRQAYHEILTITNYALDNGHNRTWTVDEYTKVLDEYQLMIIDAIADGYDGTVHDEADEKYLWSLPSSILFAATILTTIGYGHTSPVTEVGRLVCILYSVFAIPLTSIFLIKIGGAVANSIKLMYNKGCCVWCGGKRRKTRRIDEKEQEMRAEMLDEAGFVKEEYKDPDVAEANAIIKGLGGEGNEVPEPELEVEDDGVVGDHDDEMNPPTLLVLFIVVAYLFVGTIVFHLFEDGWSVINSFYCCIITLTTLGFGDMVPGLSKTGIGGQLLLAFTAFYVMVGLAVLAMGIDLIGEAFAGGGEEENEEETEEDTTAKDDVEVLDLDAAALDKA